MPFRFFSRSVKAYIVANSVKAYIVANSDASAHMLVLVNFVNCLFCTIRHSNKAIFHAAVECHIGLPVATILTVGFFSFPGKANDDAVYG